MAVASETSSLVKEQLLHLTKNSEMSENKIFITVKKHVKNWNHGRLVPKHTHTEEIVLPLAGLT